MISLNFKTTSPQALAEMAIVDPELSKRFLVYTSRSRLWKIEKTYRDYALHLFRSRVIYDKLRKEYLQSKSKGV